MWILLIIGFALGIWVGKFYWGWRAIRNITELAHEDLMRRAKLRK